MGKSFSFSQRYIYNITVFIVSMGCMYGVKSGNQYRASPFVGKGFYHPTNPANLVLLLFLIPSDAKMINDESIVKPNEVTQEDLLVVHTPGYLDSLQVGF